ncbi:MAG: phosphatidylglycerophosphatase A family protein [Gammaproteobacteria bacterium]
MHFLAFGFGLGLLPRAPGTWGSLPGLLFYWLLAPFGLSLYLVITALMALAGIWICGESSRRLGVHDHSGIVWDEIVGMMLVMAVAPDGFLGYLVAFILFRTLDIWKPWPIRELDHSLHGGLGIMLDDIVAAVYAAAALLLIDKVFPVLVI